MKKNINIMIAALVFAAATPVSVMSMEGKAEKADEAKKAPVSAQLKEGTKTVGHYMIRSKKVILEPSVEESFSAQQVPYVLQARKLFNILDEFSHSRCEISPEEADKWPRELDLLLELPYVREDLDIPIRESVKRDQDLAIAEERIEVLREESHLSDKIESLELEKALTLKELGEVSYLPELQVQINIMIQQRSDLLNTLKLPLEAPKGSYVDQWKERVESMIKKYRSGFNLTRTLC